TSDQFYDNIRKPVLVVNALNDPMLGEKCYPYDVAGRNQYLYLETPKKGGHVGFMVPGDVHTYSERRALQFIESILDGSMN
ncbi:MAG: alpha/beta hydrolase, partial [Bacteroidota bacterium]